MAPAGAAVTCWPPFHTRLPPGFLAKLPGSPTPGQFMSAVKSCAFTAMLSPAAIRQARADARAAGIRNAHFEQGTGAEGRFDVVIAIFFLHHLPDAELASLPHRLREQITPGGVFYSLDPSRRRLSGV